MFIVGLDSQKLRRYTGHIKRRRKGLNTMVITTLYEDEQLQQPLVICEHGNAREAVENAVDLGFTYSMHHRIDGGIEINIWNDDAIIGHVTKKASA